MGQRNFSYACPTADCQCVFDGAVPPADLLRVFLGGVLGIMDYKICAGEKVAMLEVLALKFTRPVRQLSRVRFVIGRINNHCPTGLKPVSERERWMIEVARSDGDIVDLKRTLDEFMVADFGAKLVELNRKVSILHLPRESVAQRFAHAFRSVDVPLAAGRKEGSEEGNALDMVPVRMTDQDMTTRRRFVGSKQVLSEQPQTGPAINDDAAAARRRDLDARGVATIADRGRARCG